MIEYHHAWEDNRIFVVLTTDVPIHLWLLWTDKPMRVHDKADAQRGLGMMWDPRFCFVEYHTIEQDEPGDTLLHHFTFPGWEHCNWRWWYFIGTFEGIKSPSASPIMSAHYETFTKDESSRHLDLTYKQPDGYIDHAHQSITGAKLRYPFAFPEYPRTPGGYPTEDYQVANKGYVDFIMPYAVREYEGTYPWGTWPITHIGWWTWNLSAHVPYDARFVEILHRNAHATSWLSCGSRKPGSLLNRRRTTYPSTSFTWFTELSPTRTIEVYAQAEPTYFSLFGYYT